MDTAMSKDEWAGKTAYKAYCAFSGNRSLVSGCELPPWDDLSQQIQGAWIAAALAVAK